MGIIYNKAAAISPSNASGIATALFQGQPYGTADNDDCSLLSCLTVLTARGWVLVIIFVLVPAAPWN